MGQPTNNASISLIVIALMLAACENSTPGPTTVPPISAAVAPANCAMTPYVNDHPPDANTAKLTDTWYANEWLWAGLVPPYHGEWYAGGVKVGWWRTAPGKLTIEGKRLDAPAPPLRADVPEGYGSSGFQATGIDFPTEGCWEVTGSVGERSLRFVVRVRPAAENPIRPLPAPDSTPTPVAG